MADATQRELTYRKRLIEIANQINAASTIPTILVGLKDEIQDLVKAERLTIFALDTQNQQLYSDHGDRPARCRRRSGCRRASPRSPASRRSRATRSTSTTRTTRPSSPGSTPSLRFDQRWDKATSFRTKQVLSAPIVFDKFLLGVLQVVNRGRRQLHARGGGRPRRSAKTLGIAFYNQRRATRTTKPTKYGYLIDKGPSPSRTSRPPSPTRG